MRPLNPPTPAAYRNAPRQAEAWREGWTAGYHSAEAMRMELPAYGAEIWTENEGRIIYTPDNAADTLATLAHEAEANGRQYSPFEFTAAAFNRSRNPDALWEAYDAGVADGVATYIAAWTPPPPKA